MLNHHDDLTICALEKTIYEATRQYEAGDYSYFLDNVNRATNLFNSLSAQERSALPNTTIENFEEIQELYRYEKLEETQKFRSELNTIKKEIATIQSPFGADKKIDELNTKITTLLDTLSQNDRSRLAKEIICINSDLKEKAEHYSFRLLFKDIVLFKSFFKDYENKPFFSTNLSQASAMRTGMMATTAGITFYGTYKLSKYLYTKIKNYRSITTLNQAKTLSKTIINIYHLTSHATKTRDT